MAVNISGSACDECARNGIIENEGGKCTVCGEVANPEELIPYRLFRDKVRQADHSGDKIALIICRSTGSVTKLATPSPPVCPHNLRCLSPSVSP